MILPHAIAAGHPVTAAAAAAILEEGGNAVDAGIAAFVASWVAEPCMSSAGGGAFALIHTADGKNHLLDFFCQTPRRKETTKALDFFPIQVDFGGSQEDFQVGLGSTGVPGSIAGVFELHRQWGSMPLRDLFQPAIEAARKGVAINGFQYLDFSLLLPILQLRPRGRSLYLRDGRLKAIGEVIQMPGLADFLDYLWREGATAFYQGEIAHKLVRDYQQGGGFLTLEDLEQYRPIYRQPYCFPYRGHLICTNPLPSTGGAILALALRELAERTMPTDPLGPEHIEQLLSILPGVVEIGARPERLRQALADTTGRRGATTHFSLVDRWGNALSLTASNGEGCGYFAEGTDIQLNNMLGEAALLPDGFHSWVPDTRLSSMMAPTLVQGPEGGVVLVTGSSGAGRIPYAILQVIHYLLDYGAGLEESVNWPRLHWYENSLNLEPGFRFSKAGLPEGIQVKEWAHSSLFFGGVNSVQVERGRLFAAADHRREGVIRLST